MGAIFLLVLLVVAGLWFVAAYNRLIALKNNVVNAWKQIDVHVAMDAAVRNF